MTSTDLAAHSGASFSLAPRSLDDAFRLADMLADSELVPKDYRGKPGNVLVAVQWGAEVGLKPLQALQNIAVINGRPSLWGDAVMALVRASPVCEYVRETEATDLAICTVKRRGDAEEQVRKFSKADAITAGLWDKVGPWKTNPKRMLQMRARAFALRDVFADVLKGIAIAEEIMDIPPDAPAAPAAAPAIPDSLLAAARTAAAGGRETFGAFYRDVTRGGKTTNEDRALLAPHVAELAAIAKKADEDAVAAKVPEEAAKPAGVNTTDAEWVAGMDSADAKGGEA